MTDPRQLNSFIKHVLLATKKQEEKKVAGESLIKQVKEVKKIAGSKKLKKEELKTALKELESRLNNIINREGRLVAVAEQEFKSSEEIKKRINELNNHLLQISSRDFNTITLLKNEIHGLEHELRIAEANRTEEVLLNKSRIEEIKATISELKEKITTLAEARMEREQRVVELEKKIKQEAQDNRAGIEHIEVELAKLREIEEKEKEKPTVFEKLRAKLRKKPKLDDFLKPKEKELFFKPMDKERELPPLPLPKQRMALLPLPVQRTTTLPSLLLPKPKIFKRPVVRHDIFFEEPMPKREIPIETKERPELPPPPKPPLMMPPEKSWMDKLKEKFKLKAF